MNQAVWDAVATGLSLAADLVLAAPVVPFEFARWLFGGALALTILLVCATSLTGKESPFPGVPGVIIGLLVGAIALLSFKATDGFELTSFLPVYFITAVCIRFAEGGMLGLAFTGSRVRRAMFLVIVVTFVSGTMMLQFLARDIEVGQLNLIKIGWSVSAALISAATIASKVGQMGSVFAFCAFIIFATVNLCIPHDEFIRQAHSYAFPLGILVSWFSGFRAEHACMRQVG